LIHFYKRFIEQTIERKDIIFKNRSILLSV